MADEARLVHIIFTWEDQGGEVFSALYSGDIPLEDAVRNMARDFSISEQGRAKLSGGDDIQWQDILDYTPKEVWEKHGIQLLGATETVVLDVGETLAWHDIPPTSADSLNNG
jgi:hypothetical protein